MADSYGRSSDPEAPLLERIKDRYEVMYEADQENREWAMDDLKFTNVPGWQWDHNMKQERGSRPCYEFNKVRIACKRIINDMRANRPAPKVRAVEGGDVEQAEIREGLLRNIWNVSDADTIMDHAGEYQVAAGMGCWRVSTDYSDDTAFDQDICIKPIQNPFTLYCDPSAKDQMKRDAADWLLTEKIPYADFEARYGDKAKSDFQDSVQFDDDEDWQDEERVRIAEYWWKEPVKKELWQVLNQKTGQMMVVDSESDEATGIAEEAIEKRREVMTNKIMWCVASGAEVLEGPTEWAGREFPFVMVYGENVFVDGRPYWWGLTRFSRDAQQEYNITRTAIAETIHQTPKSFVWATAKQAKGQTQQWAEAHKKNLPFMIYNTDPDAPGPPLRIGGADVPAALIQQAMVASEDLKAVTGIFDASMGMEGNEKSGRAIYARQQQGEIATFNYQDNMAKAVQRTGEIILDLIPEIYDTERELRILGNDGTEDYVRVNETVAALGPDGEVYETRVNDLAAGKYDVTVQVGPSFSTLRQEAAETYGGFAQQMPEMMGYAGDLVFKAMDLPYADEIAERLKAMLPPPIQQMLNNKSDIPQEAVQAMQQAEMAMQQVQQYGEMVQAAAAEVQQDSASLEQTKAQVDVAIANLRAEKAEFEAFIAEQLAKMSEKGAGLTMQAANVKSAAADAKVVTEEATEAVTAVEVGGIAEVLDDTLAGFMQAADAAMGELNQQQQILATQANRTPVGGKVRRDGGKLVADVEFDDGSTRSVAAVREDGDLKIVTPDSEAQSEAENSP